MVLRCENGMLKEIAGPVTDAVAEGKWVSYTQTGGSLTGVSYADGSGYSYLYQDPYDAHNLTCKLDRMDQDHELAAFAYDNQDRCTKFVSYSGTGGDIVYSTSSSVQVTDAYGKLRTYTISLVNGDGRKRVTSLAGPSNAPYSKDNATSWTYDSMLRLTQVTLGGGAIINKYQTYWYTRGNPSTVILASGTTEQRTISYMYHPKMSVPLSRSEQSLLSSGEYRITVWDYDNPSAVGNTDAANERPTGLLHRIWDLLRETHQREFFTH